MSGHNRVPDLRAAIAATAVAVLCVMPMARARDCRESIADLYERVSPGVVMVTSQVVNPYRLEDRVQQGLGSGFIVDESGLIITNSHVVFGAQIISVRLDDGTSLPARLIGADPILDVAALQVPKPKTGTLPVLTFGDSDQLRPGQDVIAIGNPLGLEQTVTRGIVSGLNRVLPERPLLLAHPLIQTDAPINPGNSGGPLLDRCGEVIGVNTAIIGEAQSIGFAVPSRLAVAVLRELLDKGRVVRPWVGVHGQMVDTDLKRIFNVPLVEGYLVEAVEPGSPAEEAGVRGGQLPVRIGTKSLLLGGDIIVAINGISLADPHNLPKVADQLKVGNRLKVKLFREGTYLEVEYTLPERPLQPGDVPESLQAFSVREPPRR
jgi:S1-C subfamily serine protease